MKVRSSPRRRKSTITRIAIIAVALLLLGLLLPKIITTVAGIVLLPVHSVNAWFTTSSHVFPSYLRDRETLIGEIKQLENDLAVAGGEDLTMERLRFENSALRAVLGRDDSQRIAAAVLARPSDLPYDLLLIDRGTEAGVMVGAPVFIGADTILGLVKEAAATYAFVELFTSPGFLATSFIAGPNIVATLEGYGNGVARVKVPQGIKLTDRDLVHIVNSDPGVFGRVSYIENEPTQPEQFGYIMPAVPIQSIYYVSVGTTPLTVPSPSELEGRLVDLSALVFIPGIATTSSSTASSTPL